MTRPRIAAGIAIGLVAALGCALLIVRWPWRERPRSPEARLSAQSLYEAVRQYPVLPLSDPAEIATFISASCQRPAEVTESQWRDAVRFIAEFHCLRAQGDPTAYAVWMQSNGMKLDESLRENADRTAEYKFAAGREPSADLPLAEMFAAAFRYSLEPRGGNAWPVGIVQDASACAAQAHVITASRERLPDVVTGLGDDWYGPRSQNGSRWWTPACDRECILARDGKMLRLRFSVIYATRTDLRFSVFVALGYDPAADRWFIDGATISNHGEWMAAPYY